MEQYLVGGYDVDEKMDKDCQEHVSCVFEQKSKNYRVKEYCDQNREEVQWGRYEKPA